MRANLLRTGVRVLLASGSIVLVGVSEGCTEYGVSSLAPVEPEQAVDPIESPDVGGTADQPEVPEPPEVPDPPEDEPVPEIQPAEPGDLVFSELMINPEVVDDELGEWVELYNTAGHPIDVTGYAFHDLDYDSWELTGPFVVPAHGYFVMCAETATDLNGGVPCDGWFQRVSLGGGLALANSPDEVVLTRPDGVEIDRLEYDETWFTNGVAMGVDPLELDASVNDDPAVWCDQETVIALGGEPGTPGEPNDPCW
jgi:hypothetical protein